jgi:hydrogenase nickel incorporation protein HypA/HybF
MHEVSIMQSVLDTVERIAQEQKLERVTALYLRVGILSGVVRESLEFAFEALSDDTCAAGAEMVIETVPAIFRCTKCGKEHHFVKFQFDCPDCQGPLTLAGGGRDLEITRIEG